MGASVNPYPPTMGFKLAFLAYLFIAAFGTAAGQFGYDTSYVPWGAGTARVCKRTNGWCDPRRPPEIARTITPYPTYQMMDCDADGIPDPTCTALDGKFWIISSANNCRSLGPNYTCKVLIDTMET